MINVNHTDSLVSLMRVFTNLIRFLTKQIVENMKAIDVIPMLTPAIMERIEAVVQSKPKRPDSYR